MPGSGALGRYIAWKFLVMIMATFLLCLVLIFMVDFIELLRQSGRAAAGAASGGRLIWLTLLRLPAYSELLLTFAVLVGTIATFMNLAAKSELAVMRAAGMSVWQFMRPGLLVALSLGVFAVLIYNPLAAAARAESERLFAETFGKEADFLTKQSGGNWLRQDGADGPSVLTAAAVAEKGLALTRVTIFQYTREGRFAERIDGARARLQDGFWEVLDCWVARPGQAPRRYARYLVSTHLTPDRVQDALGSAISMSIWDLPDQIETAEKSGLSAAAYRVQLELLLSRPLLLMAMVLLGATVSLRSFRSGGVQTMVIAGMVGGIGFFLLAELSRQMGVAGVVNPPRGGVGSGSGHITGGR